MFIIQSLRWCLPLTCLCLLVSICVGSPTADGLHHSSPNEKRADNFFAITGPPGTVHPRLEISQLRKNNAQWNLYLLALNRLYARGQTTRTSYYQLAGIHGRPFVEWDGVGFAFGRSGGYCPHGSTLFPTWHRPYLALYEQVLYGLVQEVANSIGGAEYQAAAKTFRIPYWDWAAPAPNGKNVLIGPIGGSAYIQISLPTGPKVIDNPLYRYHFHPLNPSDLPDDPFNKWQYTLRYPQSQNANTHSQNNLVSQQLDQSQASFSKRFMTLLQAYKTYNHFSNEAWFPDNDGNYDSLESLHDQIHGLFGTNGGHMQYIDYSAFDPVFWLHHTNVDRLFAIWQAIYPKSFVGSEKSLFGSATISEGDILTENTPLKPFHRNSAGSYWTSASARSTLSFNYNYPETRDTNIAAVKRAVNALYSVSAGQRIARRSVPEENSTQKRSIRSSMMNAFRRSTYVPANPTSSPVYTEWITNIRVAEDALPKTFHVHIFLGDATSEPTSYQLDKNLVGTHTVFTKFNGQARDLIVTGTMPLTQAIVTHGAAGKVDTTDDKCVEDYLTKNLHWKITNANNEVVNCDNLKDLKVSVVSCAVTEAKDESHFPTWSPCVTHSGITHGRPAGLKHGDPV